ncbi:MAG: NAD-binding protein, partial [Fidelibacterota bacterium]
MSLKIVIIGAGEVGFNLAKDLSREDYDITVVDINPKKIKRASETLDVSTIEGNGASPSILRQAQVENADIFLALTRIDEVNLVACRMAKELGAGKIIARLRSTEHSSRQVVIEPAQFGIDEVIHPELAVAEEVDRLLRQSSAIDVKEFEDGRLQLVGVRLEASSPLLQRTI